MTASRGLAALVVLTLVLGTTSSGAIVFNGDLGDWALTVGSASGYQIVGAVDSTTWAIPAQNTRMQAPTNASPPRSREASEGPSERAEVLDLSADGSTLSVGVPLGFSADPPREADSNVLGQAHRSGSQGIVLGQLGPSPTSEFLIVAHCRVSSPPDEPKIENGRFAPIQPPGESALAGVDTGPSFNLAQAISPHSSEPSRAGIGGGGGIFGAGGTRRSDRDLGRDSSVESKATAQAAGGGAGGGRRGSKDDELDEEDLDPDSADDTDDSDPAADDNDPSVPSSQDGAPVGSGQDGPSVRSSPDGPPVGSSQEGPPVGSGQDGPPVGSTQDGPPAGSSQDGQVDDLAAVAKSTRWQLLAPDQGGNDGDSDPSEASADYRGGSTANLPRGQARQDALTWLDDRLVAFPPLTHRLRPHIPLPPKFNDCGDDPHVVPEPSSVVGWGLLLITGGLLARRRRRKESL